MIIELVVDKFFLYIVKKHHYNMFTTYSFFFKFFTATGINNTIYSKYRIGNTKLNSKLPIVIFQINSISLIESENLGKPRLSDLDFQMAFYTSVSEIDK